MKAGENNLTSALVNGDVPRDGRLFISMLFYGTVFVKRIETTNDILQAI
jgi:hypothetical protein